MLKVLPKLHDHVKLLTRFKQLYNISTRSGSCSCQHTGLPTAQKITPYQALLFNQLWDLLHQWQLNLGHIFEMKDRCVLTKLKLPSDFTVICLLLSIAVIPFIQLWVRGGGVHKRERRAGQKRLQMLCFDRSLVFTASLPEFCPNNISYSREMALLWIKECLKEGYDKTGWLDLKHQ